MDWADTEDEAALRADIRAFIHERFPAGYVPDPDAENSLEPEDVLGYEWTSDRVAPDPARRAAAAAWAAALAERGWISPRLPAEYGGAGFTARQELILQEELMRAEVPTVNSIGALLLAPTMLEHGTSEQCSRYLPGIADGTVTWAQGFSEPDSGSDLASLRTSATRQGDEYVVNGQKVWTSLAQYADRLFVLVRTDPDAYRHRGLTMLLIDTRAPGVTIRPITDIRGSQPFNEMYFDDVRVPVADRLGAENGGWAVAMTALGYERAGIGATIKYQTVLSRLVGYLKERSADPGSRGTSGALRREIADRYVETRVLHNLARYTVDQQSAGRTPGYEASASLLFGAELNQRLARTGMSAFGQSAGLWQREGAPLDALFAHLRLDSISATFIGGASDIQRQIIAYRWLGLPRS
ncbi:acyl-CoA dehydrogenase family protein [Actinomadura graeca]|uniref:Acyl-CoA dehydrogenase family protein n=1 Tax=Actinomadura graeca TaxID=2750812 RepID=A0ABX8QV45_9ACTN|nr:acyl-CoA dehydrogenase family protein [Actinomadura graeca]QXJ22620.1 acyl-CoA dehydrogenase family protein [Actinomadura graeca]